MQNILISPSILSADFTKLGTEVSELEKAGADFIHFDVMDGHFVPNLTFGAPIVKSLRTLSKLPFDVHLMVKKPEKLIDSFAKAGANYITVHAEAVTHLDRIITHIKSLGLKAGVSLVPSSHENALDYLYEKIDLILVMTVNPGFGGQEFLSNQLTKISNISAKIKHSKRNILLSVDGGVNQSTAAQVIKAGANVLVAGTHIFSGNYKTNIEQLRNAYDHE
jgi:ribulose-phosphate 3-epimerase